MLLPFSAGTFVVSGHVRHEPGKLDEASGGAHTQCVRCLFRSTSACSTWNPTYFPSIILTLLRDQKIFASGNPLAFKSVTFWPSTFIIPAFVSSPLIEQSPQFRSFEIAQKVPTTSVDVQSVRGRTDNVGILRR